jgi:hypothetical protein
MLVGRPPYESKDVKSTYKRILENVFSFPEGVNVNEDAKNLIRCMLQVTRGFPLLFLEVGGSGGPALLNLLCFNCCRRHLICDHLLKKY